MILNWICHVCPSSILCHQCAGGELEAIDVVVMETEVVSTKVVKSIQSLG